MSTQEKLEGKFEIEPGQILTIEANGYLKGTIISNDEDTLILSQSSLDQLIDSAKREARGCIDCQKLRCEDCERLWQT